MTLNDSQLGTFLAFSALFRDRTEPGTYDKLQSMLMVYTMQAMSESPSFDQTWEQYRDTELARIERSNRQKRTSNNTRRYNAIMEEILRNPENYPSTVHIVDKETGAVIDIPHPYLAFAFKGALGEAMEKSGLLKVILEASDEANAAMKALREKYLPLFEEASARIPFKDDRELIESIEKAWDGGERHINTQATRRL